MEVVCHPNLIVLLLLAVASNVAPVLSQTVASSSPGGSVPTLNNFLETAIYGVNAIVDIRKHCVVRTNDLSGVRLGAVLNLHDEYSVALDRCGGFVGWPAVQQSQAYFHMLNIANQAATGTGGGSAGGIGSMAVDSCSSDLLSVNVAQAISVEGVLFRNRTFRSVVGVGSFDCVRDAENSLFSTPPLFALVGPMTSSDVTSISALLSAYELLHVSHWASSTAFDQTERYPYLFRSVPSNRYQASAIADMLEFFQWRYVSLLAGNDEVYSGDGFELIRAEARRRGTFCISVAARFSISSVDGLEQLNSTLGLVRQDLRSKVVVLFATAIQAQHFLRLYKEAGITGKVIIGSDDWINRLPFQGRNAVDLPSAPVLGLAPRTIVSSQVPLLVTDLRRSLRSPAYLSQASLQNPWLKLYIEQELGCSMGVSQQCAALDGQRQGGSRPPCTAQRLLQLPVPNNMVLAESVFLALLSLISVTNSLLSRNATESVLNQTIPTYPGIQEIHHALTDLTLPCHSTTGECEVFSNSSQSTEPAYHILNLQTVGGVPRRDLVSVGTWDLATGVAWDAGMTVNLLPFGVFDLRLYNASTADDQEPRLPVSVCSDDCAPGQRRLFGDMLTNAPCCWTCLACATGTFSNATNADTCHECGPGHRSNGTHCIVLETLQVSADSAQFVIVVVMAAMGLFLSVATLFYFHRHREAILVRATDLALSTLVLLAMAAGHVAAPFVIIVGPVTSAACIVHTVLPEPIKILVIGCVLVKTNRLNTIFSSMRVLGNSRNSKLFLGTPMQIVFVLFLVLLDALLLCAYQLLAPTRIETEYTGQHTVVSCSINIAFASILSAYQCILLVICIVLAFLTRKLPDNYNQSQLLYIASMTVFVVWLGLAPAFFITGKTLRPFISALFLEAVLWSVWLCLYLPRMYMMLRYEKYRIPHSKQKSVLGISTTGSNIDIIGNSCATPTTPRTKKMLVPHFSVTSYCSDESVSDASDQRVSYCNDQSVP